MKDQLKAHLPNIVVIDTFGGSEGGNQGQHVGRGADGTAPRFRADAAHRRLRRRAQAARARARQVGMLARRGRIPLGYYKDEEKTARTFVEVDGERWVLPGDMAMVEADGTITLLGRGSACINSGGEKIFPEEVEAALRSHPAVFDAVVVGVPDERWGERVTAVVQPRPGANAHAGGARRALPRARLRLQGAARAHARRRIVRQPSGKPDYQLGEVRRDGRWLYE